MSGAAAAGGAPTEKSPLLSSSASPSVRHNRTASNESSGAEDEPPDPSPQMSLARGSILSSVVNLCTATLGAGCLALPWAMAQCGLLLGLLMLFAAGVSSNWTIRLLVRLYATDQHTSFESLALRSFGQAGAMVTHFTVLLFCFGAAVASVMVVGDVLEPVCKLLLPDVHFLHHKTTIVVLLTLCIMLPLSFFTHISSMRVMSLVSTAGVLVLALVMLLRGGEALFTGRLQSIQLARFDSGILLALPVIMFAYACHTSQFTRAARACAELFRLNRRLRLCC
jgi:amino acid permease